MVGACVAACTGEIGDNGGLASNLPEGACSKQGEQLPCYPGSPVSQSVGACHDGVSTCEDGEWSSCSGFQLPAEESCEGLDDNCNGAIDDGCGCEEGSSRSCYTGPAYACDIGICASGLQHCVGGVWAAECEGQNQQPKNEVCGDGKDNDCNGQLDNGCPCAHNKCSTGSALVSGCSSCVTSICQADSYCCTNSWDSVCVGEVQTICGLGC